MGKRWFLWGGEGGKILDVLESMAGKRSGVILDLSEKKVYFL